MKCCDICLGQEASLCPLYPWCICYLPYHSVAISAMRERGRERERGRGEHIQEHTPTYRKKQSRQRVCSIHGLRHLLRSWKAFPKDEGIWLYAIPGSSRAETCASNHDRQLPFHTRMANSTELLEREVHFFILAVMFFSPLRASTLLILLGPAQGSPFHCDHFSILKRTSSPGWVAQLVRALSRYTKVAGSIPDQGKYKNRPVNASIRGTTD